MTSIATILNDNPSHAKIFKISGEISAKIGIRSYIVGGYVRDALLNRETNDIDIMVEGDVINQFYPNFIEKKWAGKYRIDLQKLALHQLIQNGFKREKITTLSECTYCDAEKYHSYRRNGKKAGRMIGLLGYC